MHTLCCVLLYIHKPKYPELTPSRRLVTRATWGSTVSFFVLSIYVAILQFPDRLCKTEANKIFMRQSDLLPLPNGAAATIYESLVNSLKEKDIPMENVIGFCADSCNVMFGVNHSVAQMLVRDYP